MVKRLLWVVAVFVYLVAALVGFNFFVNTMTYPSDIAFIGGLFGNVLLFFVNVEVLTKIFEHLFKEMHEAKADVDSSPSTGSSNKPTDGLH